MSSGKVTASNFQSKISINQYIWIFLLVAGVALAFFQWEGHQGFDLWDEGFLWYGAQRVLQGEVPIRDFMAYDPGRYYWSAMVMSICQDNGILALRGATTIFMVLGLFIGLTALSNSAKKQNFLFWLLSAVTLAVWMFPLYKLFDVALSIALVASLAFLVHRPTGYRYFITGVFIGLIAVFGRNHGVYGIVGSLSIMAYLLIEPSNGIGPLRSFMMWSTGIIVGYLPILLLLVAVPDFALAFWESTRLLIKTGILPLPAPWPWTVSMDPVFTVEAAHGILLGCFFIVIILFGILSITWVIRQRIQNKPAPHVLVASAFLALPYAHYAYSRADTLHLAMGVIPFIMGSLALLLSLRPILKWSLAGLLCGASLMVMAPLHPGWVCFTSQQCVAANIGRDTLIAHPNVPVEIGMLKSLSEKFAPNGRNFIVTPFWPGAYAVMNQKSPMWGIYLLLPRGEAFERAEIERIKTANPGYVLVINSALDGREELRFSNTHPRIDQYIRDNFERLDGYTPDPVYQLFVNGKEPQ